MTLVISAVNQTVVSDVLTNGHLHRAVTVKHAILDDSDAVIETFEIYKGFIESMSISDSGDKSKISFGVANHWSDFDRIEGRLTNSSSQQHHHDGDLGFDFVPQVGRNLYWGNLPPEPLQPGDGR